MSKHHAEVWVKNFFLVLEKLKLSTYKLGFKKPGTWLLKYKLGPLGRTQRKPRTISKNMYGSSVSDDFASFWTPDSPAKKKLDKRIANGLCVGCGAEHSNCRCKRKSK